MARLTWITRGFTVLLICVNLAPGTPFAAGGQTGR